MQVYSFKLLNIQHFLYTDIPCSKKMSVYTTKSIFSFVKFKNFYFRLHLENLVHKPHITTVGNKTGFLDVFLVY